MICSRKENAKMVSVSPFSAELFPKMFPKTNFLSQKHRFFPKTKFLGNPKCPETIDFTAFLHIFNFPKNKIPKNLYVLV